MEQEILLSLFEDTFNNAASSIQALPPSGSARRYFRLSAGEHTAIGVYNPDLNENKAFISFTRHFLKKGLSVPSIYAVAGSMEYYLIQDLGNTTLKDYTDKLLYNNTMEVELLLLYKLSLNELIKFQIYGHKGFDYSLCVPRACFDRQSILWDLNHFKYFFLKLSGIPFDEQQLEDDFRNFAGFLSSVSTNSFLFRDFQSRNIMIYNNKPYFIDYQGGRKGALMYDPASLLFEARTNLPFEFRELLLDYYLDELEKHRKINRESFKKSFYHFALIRTLQALGAYGLRGMIEKKGIFLQSIPYAIKNLSMLVNNFDAPVQIPELIRVSEKLISEKKFQYSLENSSELLSVRIYSFSYRKGLPDDLSGNGGGFVFDCRGIKNPGKFREYAELTGKDCPVQIFLEKESEMLDFLDDVFRIIKRHIDFCIENNYTNIHICFGCTGGRHRSVYAAEKTARTLNNLKDIRVSLLHSEIL